jgi:hypothetical protein
MGRGVLPSELAGLAQWVCWKYGQLRPNGKRAKQPVNPITGEVGNALDPALWCSYSDAVVGEVIHGCDGIGFVLTEDDPYCAIDLDNVIGPTMGTIDKDAQALVNSIDTYWEVSPSLTGLRGILKGTKPGQRSRTRATSGVEVELYDAQRFVTITGIALDGADEVQECQQELTSLYGKLFGVDVANNTVRIAGVGHPGSDEELLSRARNVGQWKMFRKLYQDGRWWDDFKSQSEADFKLCTMLAFWCGPDSDRIDRLFRRSRLMREKWYEQRGAKTYGEQTTDKAIQTCPYFYSGKVEVTEAVQASLYQRYSWWLSCPWDYRGGDTDRHVYRALLDHSAKHGAEHPKGIVVSMGSRDVMVEARVGSRNTVDNSLGRLEEKHGAIEVLERGKGRRATKFLLKEGAQECAINNTVYVYGSSLSARVRNPSRYISSIGKRNAQILDILYTTTPPVPLAELARLLNVKRPRNLKRNIARLEAWELIEEVEGGYVLPQDFEVNMERYLEESGTNMAEELQRAKVAREQEAFRSHQQPKPKHADAIEKSGNTTGNAKELEELLRELDKEFSEKSPHKWDSPE